MHNLFNRNYIVGRCSRDALSSTFTPRFYFYSCREQTLSDRDFCAIACLCCGGDLEREQQVQQFTSNVIMGEIQDVAATS